MARITRNSYKRSANRVKVVEQFGVPLTDADFNEAQDILGVNDAESAALCFASLRSTDSGVQRMGVARGDEWKPYASGTNTILITKGTLFVDGFQLVLDADLDLATEGVVFPSAVGNLQGWIYVDIVFEEQDSTADPDLGLPYIGETAVRQVLSMTFAKSEGATFAAAFAAIPALPVVSDARLWKGNTARVFLARYKRANGTTDINGSDVYDLRGATPAEMHFKQPFVKMSRTQLTAADEGSGKVAGVVIWDYGNSKLQFGMRGEDTSFNDPSDSSDQAGAMQINVPGGPIHRILSADADFWKASGATTNDDGVSLTYDVAVGYTLSPGQCLGYLANGASTTLRSQMRTKKGTSAHTDVYAITPTPGTEDPLLVEGLVVDSLATFEAAIGQPGTFILCYRKGDDLIWWNGHITRALRNPNSSNGIVIDDPTVEVGSNYDLIVGRHGATHGDAHFLLDAGLNVLASQNSGGGGAGVLSNGVRIKAYAQVGLWDFPVGQKKYGSAIHADTSESWDVDNNSFVLEGDGPGMSKLTLHPKKSADRTVTDLGEMEIWAQKIVLRGLTIETLPSSLLNDTGYALKLVGADVVLEDCHFHGGVLVQGNNVTIRNCSFHGYGEHAGVGGGGNFAYAQGHLVAQHLYLDGSSLPYANKTTGNRWLVEDCHFSCHDETENHASMVIAPNSAATDVMIRNNGWRYRNNSGLTDALTAIDVRNEKGNITIENNTFRGSRGSSRAGTPGGTDPWTGGTTNHYAGSINRLAVGTKYIAAAYISVTAGRARESSLTVKGNTFVMDQVGLMASGQVAARYRVWACCAVVTNANHIAAAIVCNVRFEDNVVQMWPEAGSGWAAVANNEQPAIYGFVCAPDLPNSATFTGYVCENISVRRNIFDLGGHGAAAFAWRSIWSWLGSGTNPAYGNWLHVVSAPVVIATHRGNCGLSVGITEYVNVSDNQITQRATAAGAYQTALAAIGDHNLGAINGPPAAANDIWGFRGIICSADGTAYAENTGDYMNEVAVDRNIIRNVAFTPNADGYYNAIYFGFGTRQRAAENIINLPSADGAQGIFRYALGGSCLALNNYIEAHTGLVNDNFQGTFASGNRFVGTTFFAGGVDAVFTGGGSGDNFV